MLPKPQLMFGLMYLQAIAASSALSASPTLPTLQMGDYLGTGEWSYSYLAESNYKSGRTQQEGANPSSDCQLKLLDLSVLGSPAKAYLKFRLKRRTYESSVDLFRDDNLDDRLVEFDVERSTADGSKLIFRSLYGKDAGTLTLLVDGNGIVKSYDYSSSKHETYDWRNFVKPESWFRYAPTLDSKDTREEWKCPAVEPHVPEMRTEIIKVVSDFSWRDPVTVTVVQDSRMPFYVPDARIRLVQDKSHGKCAQKSAYALTGELYNGLGGLAIRTQDGCTKGIFEVTYGY